jgi:hypothetical protein
MDRPIRLLDPVSARMTSAVCRGAASLTEVHLSSGNHTTVTVLCRPCLTRLAHAITGRLLQLDADRTASGVSNAPES